MHNKSVYNSYVYKPHAASLTQKQLVHNKYVYNSYMCSNHITFFWLKSNLCTINMYTILIWGVSRQLPQRAAREPQTVLFLTHIYDTKMCFKKLFDKRFRRIFSSAFQWRRQFFRNFPFSAPKSTKRDISKSVFLIFFVTL